MWIGKPLEEVNGRKYYSSLRLPDGSSICIGEYVKVSAPKEQPPFLAQIVAFWLEVSSGFKLMRCRWFFRPYQALQASALQKPDSQHPREVFLSDEYDENYVTTIIDKTVIVHRDSLPQDFNLDSLKIGDHFFYRSKYDRQSRTFSPAATDSYRENFEGTREHAEAALNSCIQKLVSNAMTLQPS
ncbi:hypothetical protein GUITHDRAFT_153093 [Guillardia theta CCMP2712]|uniref:BAH domain-containing protein n=1 Tax=Guillardia theta (strain CCMP2712) TaxID=905079 RepID=L1J6P7_GUITC|nr:hypothetical protein GUITHDRAFT_153093 [Guillardia theta CCMP2712]EKX44218.1 hypothetical protein GUITHDRAFT_153093 [Guillardia theta CCMP2712]|eukprot:XP_005831198.1 hypothetical protein GUITHDRAFT_153093 [Guillardia theta CCMP2712]